MAMATATVMANGDGDGDGDGNGDGNGNRNGNGHRDGKDDDSFSLLQNPTKTPSSQKIFLEHFLTVHSYTGRLPTIP